MPNDEYEKMTIDALQARLLSLPTSNLNSPEYNALLAAINKKSKEKDEMARLDAQQKHEETIVESRKSNKLSISAIIISFLSLLVAIGALYISYRSSTSEQRKTITELHAPATTVSPPAKITNANKQKFQSRPTNTQQ